MNIESPLLSVIIPVYNVEKYIGRCLDSIISQTFTNWECIIIDDGSPDKSGMICDEYAQNDSRIRVVHKKNNGVGSARNDGISKARGRYLTFIDSDDTIEPETFATYIKYANQCDWVMIGVRQVDLELNPIKNSSKIDKDIISTPESYEDTLITATRIWMMFGSASNKMYRTDIIREHGLTFIQSTNINEDRIFNLYYAGYAESVTLSSYIGYNYVVNPKSITHKKIASATFLNTGIELDNILKRKLLGEKMQRYTAIFSIRFLTRAIITGLISPTQGRWKEVSSAVQFYFHSNAFKSFGIRTWRWSLVYIINGIKRIKI